MYKIPRELFFDGCSWNFTPPDAHGFLQHVFPTCASGTLPLVAHHCISADGLKGQVFHFFDGDSGYLVASKILSMSSYVIAGFEVAFKDSGRL